MAGSIPALMVEVQIKNDSRLISVFPLSSLYPEPLLIALQKLERQCGETFYLTGGTIRDLLLGRQPADLDLAVCRGAAGCCRMLLGILGEGALVKLGTEEEEAARVVYKGITVDFSSFRKKATTIEEELCHRDFTINAMALSLKHAFLGNWDALIDPLGGKSDLKRKMLRCCPESFIDDPLRMLRLFRFHAELGFALDPPARAGVLAHASLLDGIAAERIAYEMNRIMDTAAAEETVRKMVECSLFWQVVPEMREGLGLQQPGYHHEDVFFHNVLALGCVERVIEAPRNYFGESASELEEYLQRPGRRRLLRWAALFHDLGKPATCTSAKGDDLRVTFYNHDRVGRQIFETIAERLRWSREETRYVGTMIEMHMHPFHLSNARRKSSLSRKALLKLYKKAGDDLAGLFILAMADSLAGQGEMKPDDMETELSLLFEEVRAAVEKHIKPAVSGERLLSGDDLVAAGFVPGPLFRIILDEIELARVEGRVSSRSEALDLVGECFSSGRPG